MRSIFIDPSVLLLAVGGAHPWREPCRRVLEAAARGEVRLHLSVEGGQEFLFHRLRRGDLESAVHEFDLVDRLVVWHPFDTDVLHRARDLVAAGGVRGRDAVHAATAMLAGFDALVSCDRDFDAVPGLSRVDPSDVDSW